MSIYNNYWRSNICKQTHKYKSRLNFCCYEVVISLLKKLFCQCKPFMLLYLIWIFLVCSKQYYTYIYTRVYWLQKNGICIQIYIYNNVKSRIYLNAYKFIINLLLRSNIHLPPPLPNFSFLANLPVNSGSIGGHNFTLSKEQSEVLKLCRQQIELVKNGNIGRSDII